MALNLLIPFISPIKNISKHNNSLLKKHACLKAGIITGCTAIHSAHILVLPKCFCIELRRTLSAHRDKCPLSAPFFIFFGNWLQSAHQSESCVHIGNSSLKSNDSYQFGSQPHQTGNVLVCTKCSKWCLQFKLLHIFLVFWVFFPPT